MVNSLYALGRQAFLEGNIDFLDNTIIAALLDAADYTIDLNAHDFWNDVPSGARVASATLGSKTATNGTADAGDSTFTSVTGDPCEYINIRADTGTESTSRLIGNMDTATGLPVTPNGGNINVAWNASGIFTL